MIGAGIDLVENARLRETLDRWGDRFKGRVFLEAERTYCERKASPWLYYAGRFAVKEAVAKAFGTGIGPSLAWLDIEVVRDARSGAPSVCLHGKGRELARARRVGTVLVSLSHTRNFSIAEALLLGNGEERVA